MEEKVDKLRLEVHHLFFNKIAPKPEFSAIAKPIYYLLDLIYGKEGVVVIKCRLVFLLVVLPKFSVIMIEGF